MKRRWISLAVLAFLFSKSVYGNPVVGGVDHVGLAVGDLKASEQFFVEHLGFHAFRRDNNYPAVFLKNAEVIITLWRVKDPKTANVFDRRNNVGLHHLAFSVDSFESLDELYRRMQKVEGVNIEFAPELLGSGPAKHMMIYEPSGNRIEFIHRPDVK